MDDFVYLYIHIIKKDTRRLQRDAIRKMLVDVVNFIHNYCYTKNILV